MYTANGVEVLQYSSEVSNYIKLPAASADTWQDGAFIYWDTSANTIKKWAPADATENQADQNVIIGISSGGKKNGDIESVVCLKATILITKTGTVTLGKDCVITYDTTTLKYGVQEESAWNTTYEPDVTLSGNFAVYAANAAEGDGRVEVFIDGAARVASLT